MVSTKKTATQPTRHIHLALTNETSLGRGVLEGFSAYGGHRLDWRCGLVGVGESDNAGPPDADALVGNVRPEMAGCWDAEQCRTVINISRAREVPNIASVTCDDHKIGRLAADHLLGKELKVFAYVGPVCNREAAFAERVTEHDAQYLPFFTDDKKQGDLENWLAGLPSLTGIMTFNDCMAVRLLWTAHSLGRAVPEDLSVIGVDADYVQSLLSPVPLSSVNPDFYTVGYRAAELLDRTLNGYDARGERIRIPPAGVVEQASSDFPGINDPVVTQAARFIRRHACEGIFAKDVAAAMPLSRRPLERRFRNTFQRTLSETIRRVRINEAARLLAGTRFPVAHVAEQAGFKSHARFTEAFRTLVGISPAAYRRRHGQKSEG